MTRKRSSGTIATPPAHEAGNIVAATGMVAAFTAFAAASCCVLPRGLAVLGLGGGWLAGLGILVRYQPLIAAVAVVVLALAWLSAFRPWRRTAPGARRPPRTTRLLLGAATLLTVLALTRAWREPAAIDWLWAIWVER
jgi:mercuric ion transport protein